MQYELTTLGAAGERVRWARVWWVGRGECASLHSSPCCCRRLALHSLCTWTIVLSWQTAAIPFSLPLALSLSCSLNSFDVAFVVVFVLLLLQFVCIWLVVVVGLENWQRVRSFEYWVDFFKFFSFIYVIVVCICSACVCVRVSVCFACMSNCRIIHKLYIKYSYSFV